MLENVMARRHWKVVYIAKNGCEELNDYAFFDDSTILINDNHTPEIKFYIMTHEFGHLLVAGKRNYKERYAMLFTKKYSSLSYRVCRIEEEIGAWEAGREFVEKNISKEVLTSIKYWALRSSMISTYIMWVAGKKVMATNANRKYRKRQQKLRKQREQRNKAKVQAALQGTPGGSRAIQEVRGDRAERQQDAQRIGHQELQTGNICS
jgi:hypothetical protein